MEYAVRRQPAPEVRQASAGIVPNALIHMVSAVVMCWCPICLVVLLVISPTNISAYLHSNYFIFTLLKVSLQKVAGETACTSKACEWNLGEKRGKTLKR